jgi:hypothetical protein
VATPSKKPPPLDPVDQPVGKVKRMPEHGVDADRAEDGAGGDVSAVTTRRRTAAIATASRPISRKLAR